MSNSYVLMTKEMIDKQKKNFKYTPRVTEAIKQELRDRDEAGVMRTGIIGESMWDRLSPDKLLDNPPKSLLSALEKVAEYGDWLYLYLGDIEEEEYKERKKIMKEKKKKKEKKEIKMKLIKKIKSLFSRALTYVKKTTWLKYTLLVGTIVVILGSAIYDGSTNEVEMKVSTNIQATK